MIKLSLKFATSTVVPEFCENILMYDDIQNMAKDQKWLFESVNHMVEKLINQMKNDARNRKKKIEPENLVLRLQLKFCEVIYWAFCLNVAQRAYE